ncbi:MAG: cellulase family glycosylhydrolase [Verrucomicrobiota bacterium]
MKKFFTLAIAACLMCALNLHAEPKTVTVDPNAIVSKDFMGFGVQWSPYPWFDITDSDWQRVFDRLDYMRVPLVRVMTRAYKYCDGFDADGKPIYQWNNNRMRKMYQLLDYCERRNVTVILGEWDDPASDEDRADKASDKLQKYDMEETDPRWHSIIADLLEHLLNDKKYTCIKYFNLINEPNGNWSGCADFTKWKPAIAGLHAEFKKRGLDKKIQITGPDVTWMRDYNWLDRAVLECANDLGAYDVHEYIAHEDLESGYAEKIFWQKRDFINRYDPNGRKKPFFMGEVGMNRRGPVEPQGGEDSHPKVYEHIYGVWMTDYNIQCARAGMQGTIAWMLDDAMHINKDKDTKWPDIHQTLFKKWGFFNSLAEEIGHPEDANLRPWYFTWSLMSRGFPRGCTILPSSPTELPGLRTLAAKIGSKDYTFAVVNDSDQPCEIRLKMDVANSLDLKQYNYFETERLTDDLGYPKMKRLVKSANLKAGLPLALPKRSVIFLTTLPD